MVGAWYLAKLVLDSKTCRSKVIELLSQNSIIILFSRVSQWPLYVVGLHVGNNCILLTINACIPLSIFGHNREDNAIHFTLVTFEMII